MSVRTPFVVVLLLLGATIGCIAPSAVSGDPVATSVAATVAASRPSATPTLPPTPEPTPLPPRLWMSYTSGGETAWWLQDGAVTQTTLPVQPGQYYDYAPANGKILYASHFASKGEGPGNLAVSDLWMVDYPSGTPVMLIPDDIVVEALWTPDGAGFVYILATPETYELRHRLLSGGDTLLASNVAPTWSVSPNGTAVAFTRETGYDVPGAPGLYVVPMDGGPEVMISTEDRHGSGSIDDKPLWSLDGARLALPIFGEFPLKMIVASPDGAFSAPLTFTPELAADPSLGTVPTTILWHPDGIHLVGVGNVPVGEGMGGPSTILLYTLAEDGHTVTAATQVATGYGLIDWNVPGRSVYFVNENGQPALATLP
ncbi:MAG TPA: hypothetical protein VLL77_05180 [Anaerolineales bacterium]|nr:hypothetical protein [Anaerolineales bacterium]